RIYFYDSKPATDQLINPLDKSVLNLGNTRVHSDNTGLQQALELRPDFALRAGETVVHGGQVGPRALESVAETPRTLQAGDLIPNVEQRGVDLRIGLDIARLALRLVTGDSDFIPALKFACREGVRVYLDHMGHGVKRELKVLTDLVL